MSRQSQLDKLSALGSPCGQDLLEENEDGQYMVRLTEEERQQLSTLITTRRAAAVKLLYAQILIKADVRDDTGGSDAEITAALGTSESTTHRVRQAWVEQGWEEAVCRKPPTRRQYRQLDGAQEARLLALACRAPSEGRTRGPLKL